MKYLKFFEAWSSKFHQDLQAAYAQAELTDKGHGKIKKDILAYTTRQVSEEKFTLVEEGTFGEIDFYINPEFLLKRKLLKAYNSFGKEVISIEPIITELRMNDSGRDYVQQPIINGKALVVKNVRDEDEKYYPEIQFNLKEPSLRIEGFPGLWSLFTGRLRPVGSGSSTLTSMEPKYRFKTKRMLEDFITMVTKAMLSVPGQTPDGIEQNKALLQKLIDTNQNYFL